MTSSPDLTLDLAGLKVKFLGGGSALSLSPAPKFETFVTGGSPDVCLEVRRFGFPQVQALTAPRFGADNWSFSLLEGQVHLRLSPFPHPTPHPIQAVQLDPDGRRGELWAFDERLDGSPVAVPPVVLDEVSAVYLLARGWGVMLHASGIRTARGEGLLFSGVSGAGKSTTARLWAQSAGTCLLSDERVALRQQEGGFTIHGTPWNSQGGASTPGSAPLRALFLIQHAPTNQARRLEPAEALARLMPQVFLPYGDPQGLAFTLGLLDELVRGAACFELGFLPDASAVAFVQDLLAHDLGLL